MCDQEKDEIIKDNKKIELEKKEETYEGKIKEEDGGCCGSCS